VARKYTRDNRGRFASTGATARGGRLRTASGGKRERQTISAMSGDRMSSVPQGAIGKTRKQREITMIDRPQAKRQAFNQGSAQQKAAIAARNRPSIGSIGAKLAARDKATGRGDGAAVNIPMSGARGKRLDAEISRNVKAQAVQSRKESKARNVQFKSDQSRAKKLRAVHGESLAKSAAAKSGKPVSEARAALKSMAPSAQIKMLKGWVKQNRGNLKPPAPVKAKAASGGLRKRQGGMDARQKEALGGAKADVAIQKQRVQAARKAKASAAGPLEKLKATGRINEYSLNVSRATDRVTRMVARPMAGRPITGAGRFGNTMRNSRPSRPNAIRGKVARDPNVRAKVKGAVNLDAGKFRKVYAFNANKAAKPAAPKAQPKAAKPAKKTAEQRAQGVLARALAVTQKAKYDPRTRKEINTSKTAVRAFAMYNDLGANPLRQATPQQLKTLGRNLKNRDKLKQVGAQARWTSPRTKASDEAMRRRESERRGRYGLY